MSKPNKNIVTYCEIDKTQFSTTHSFLYHLRKLGTTQKEYYDRYMKFDGEGICKECSGPSKFKGVGHGYSVYCSYRCASINEDARRLKYENTKKALLKKYGVENPGQLKDHREKLEKTCLEKYGDAHYVNVEKAEKTCLQKYGKNNYAKTDEFKKDIEDISLIKYGVKHFTQNSSVKNKAKSTCRKKYGTDSYTQTDEYKNKALDTVNKKYGGYTLASKILRKKYIKTMIGKYGVDNPLKNKDLLQKVQSTNIKRYGGKASTNSAEVIKKIKKTNLAKYGVENTFNTPKTKNTFIEKYGVINPSQIPEVQEKIKGTCLRKYGADAWFKSDTMKSKSKQTCLKKYGVEHPMQNEEIRNKVMKSQLTKSYRLIEYKTIFGDLIHYQSIPELQFIKACEANGTRILNGPVLNYTLCGKNHKYFSDFLVSENSGKRIVEIKRKHVWWYRDLKSGMMKEKARSAILYSQKNKFLPYKILFGDAVNVI